MPQSFKLGKNWRMLQGRRLNLRNWKTKRQLFEHGAIEKLPKQRQHCTGNTAEFHFPLSEFLLPFPHICLCIQACSSICSPVRLGSSHCFVDKVFAKKNKSALTKLPSTIPLQLFDRSAWNSKPQNLHSINFLHWQNPPDGVLHHQTR